VIAVIEVTLAAVADRETQPSARLLEELAAAVAGPLALVRRLREVRHRTETTQHFADRALAVQEAERARLSREIHDGLSQQLAGLGFHLSAAASVLDTEPIQARLQIEAARELAELASAETRAAIAGLRPPVLDDLGLPAAIASLTRRAAALPDAPEIVLTVIGDPDTRLPDHLQTALYRIAQEALRNALRHAAASTIDVILQCSVQGADLSVRDNGRGVRLSAGGLATASLPEAYGLRSMRERAELVGGSLSISSRPGRGTTVRASVPRPPSA